MKKKSRVKHAVAFGPACTCQIISLAPPLSLTLPPPPYAHLLHFIVLAMVDGHGIKFPFPYLGHVRQF